MPVDPLTQLPAAASADPRFEPDRLHEAVRKVLDPFEGVGTARELRALWWTTFSPWLPWRFLRPRLDQRPGGPGVSVRVRSIELATFRIVGPHEPAEAVFRVVLGIRLWPRVPVLGPIVRALQLRSPADRVLWLSLVAAPAGAWHLGRSDVGRNGNYHLAAQTVSEPAGDPGLADAVRHELAEDDAIADPGALLRFDGDAEHQLLDLSLVDGRFSPVVVEASVRTLMSAWRQLVIGGEGAFEAFAGRSSPMLAEYARAADLPLRLEAVEVLAVVATPQPTLFLRVRAVVRARGRTARRDLWWQLVLDDELDAHWRLASAYARPELRRLGRS